MVDSTDMLHKEVKQGSMQVIFQLCKTPSIFFIFTEIELIILLEVAAIDNYFS